MDDFSQFFSNKVHRMRNSIVAKVHQLTGPVFTPRLYVGAALTEFSRLTDDEVLKVLGSTRIKTSPIDLLRSSLLHESTGVFAPYIAYLANLSFSECCFPPAFNTAQAFPLLKKSGLDAAVLSNFRPISNRSTVFKILERLALTRLRRHLHGSPDFSRF